MMIDNKLLYKLVVSRTSSTKNSRSRINVSLNQYFYTMTVQIYLHNTIPVSQKSKFSRIISIDVRK